MKKHNRNNLSITLTIGLIFTLFIFNGCHEKQDYLATEYLENIQTWSQLTKEDRNTVNNILELSENHFTFQLEELTSEPLHAYIGFDLENSQLNFSIIDSTNDRNFTPGEAIPWLANENLSKTMKSMPVVFLDNIYNNPNSVSISDTNAYRDILNWADPDIRKDWINSATEIVQVFHIQTKDLDVGALHTCYLALKTDTIEGKVTYTPDLIVIDEFILEEPINNDQLRMYVLDDVVCPMPPFGSCIGTDESNYGIYNYVNQ